MKYLEKDTQEYYDEMNTVYNSFWDFRGSLHWGLFNKKTDSLETAFDNLTRYFIEYLDSSKELLNIGSGNGYVDLELSDKKGFKVTGIDLSPKRVEYANKLKERYNKLVQDNVNFLQGSGTKLPFEDDEYRQVMSQATFYHVHDKDKLFKEVSRVIAEKGILIFDDLFKPKENISDNARINVYERLLFDTPYNFETYQENLRNNNFAVNNAIDLTNHMYITYALLKNRLEKEVSISEGKKLIKQYEGTLKAIDDKEVGWGLFQCQKI